MDAVHVVALQHILEDSQGVRGGSGFARVHPELVAIGLDPGRLGLADMAGMRCRAARALPRPKGVEPGVQLYAACVGQFNPQGQRVVKRFGRLALGAGEVLAPGLER